MSENQHTPLWKQLLGAATGAVVALLLYAGFAAASPSISMLTAYLLSDFEEKIENMPEYPQSPRTVRDETIAWREELGDRARAATARLQKGENYFRKSSLSSSSATTSVPLGVKKEVKNQQQKEEAVPEETTKTTSEKRDQDRSEQKAEKNADPKRKEEKLPDTGIPFWAIGGVAFCLAMSIRYRKELLGAALPLPAGEGMVRGRRGGQKEISL